jgi:hypothetical protein
VAYLLKARNAEPEKQLLLADGSEKHSLLSNRFLISKYTQPLLSDAFTKKQVPTETSEVQ